MKVYAIFNGKDPAADNLSAAEAVLREKKEYGKTAVFFACSEKEPQVRTCLSMGFDDAFVIDCSILQAEEALSVFLKKKVQPGDAIVCGEHCWDDGVCPASAGISERTGIEVQELQTAGTVPHTPSFKDINAGMSKPVIAADPGKINSPVIIFRKFSLRSERKCIIFTQERNDIIRLISRLRQL